MRDNTTVSIAVLSGKGGVGKSNLALNICYALHQLGNNVLLMDCDMGLANMDVLLGIAPEKHLQDMLLENQDPSSILLPIGPHRENRLDLIPANSGMAEFVELDAGTRSMLRAKLNPLACSYDFLCMDIGAGISATALGFGAMATVRVVVITPEPTSLTDSYAMIKVMASRNEVTDFYVLVNQVESSQEAKQTYNRLSAACQRFLGFSPLFLGEVRTDRSLIDAVRKQKPLMEVSPHAPAAVDCMNIAHALERLRETLIKEGSLEEPLRPVKITD
jgi:ATPases involved in chromosome partitioning